MKFSSFSTGWSLFLTLLLGAVSGLSATETQSLVFDSYGDFATGNCRSSTLSESGELEAAPSLKVFADVKADQIWKILQETEGNYLVGTSPEARLYRVLAGGQVTEVYKFPGTHIYALAKSRKGELFAAVSPQGKIYRLNPKGKPTLYFDTKQTYVWDLAFDKEGNLYAATGVEGKIFKITGEGQGSLFYASDEVHVRCLAFDKLGFLWAGSADTGLLYRISPKGEAVVITSTARQEINHVVVAEDGSVYFSATGSAKRPTNPNRFNSSGNGTANLPTIILNFNESNEGSQSSFLSSNPFNGLNFGTDNIVSQVWKVDASLFAQPIWGTRETILTLDARHDGVYVGTANQGYLYRLGTRNQATRILRVESSVLSATLWLDNDRALVASSNPAKIYLTGPAHSGDGIYESKVIDSGLFARWGAIHLGTQGTVSVRTRSGNTPDPDKTWNPWVSLENDHVASPASRFLQFELDLSRGQVDRAELFYLPRNMAPHVEQIQILPVGIGYTPIVLPSSPPQPKSAEQLLSQANHPDIDMSYRQPNRFQPVEGKGYRTVTWRATDLNDDELRYVVSYRAFNSSTWRVLAKDLQDPVYSWDTSGWADGKYFLKVSASDEIDNPPGQGLMDELESKMFYVDNTAPSIRILSVRDGVVHFRVREEVSGLKSVTISHDGDDYRSLAPVDGILDSPEEDFTAPIGKSEVLFIRAEDNAGNIAGAQAGP